MTQSPVTPFSCIVIGNESLLIQCSEILLQRGHQVQAIVSNRSEITKWAQGKGLRVVAPDSALAKNLQGTNFDWLFSVANLSIIPDNVLAQANTGAVNFHDGPLPAYAGLNAPVWALLNREKQHGITWHLMQGGVDEGDIVEQNLFDIADGETALSLNTKCFAAAIDSFTPMLEKLESGAAEFTKQDLSQRKYFAKNDRPAAAGRLDFNQPAEDLITTVNGLDHGRYWNPLTSAKIEIAGQVYLVGEANGVQLGAKDTTAGLVLAVADDTLSIATSFGGLRLGCITDQSGKGISLADLVTQGDVLTSLSADQVSDLTRQTTALANSDGFWRKKLQHINPTQLPQATARKTDAVYSTSPLNIGPLTADKTLLAKLAGWAARLQNGAAIDLAFRDAATTSDTNPTYHAAWVPLRFDTEKGSFAACEDDFSEILTAARKHQTYARDLLARDPAITAFAIPDIGIALDEVGPISGTCLTISITATGATLHYDTNRITDEALNRLAAQLAFLISSDVPNDTPIHALPILPEAERELVLNQWNNTGKHVTNACIHHLFEAQAAKTPDATALVFESTSLTYAELNTRANRVAHVLADMGVKPGTMVGLFTPRSLDMMIGALAIQKAGAAYVPLDPSYPENRIAHFIQDSGAPVILTTSAVLGKLPSHDAQTLLLDTDPRIERAGGSNLDSGVTSQDLAYLIYTSGSTGLPKGVMVEHANVSNFFAGMDDKINHNPPGVWLAVTSLSFDISVLELFYTLARGFKVVLNSDASRVMPSGNTQPISDQKMAFSLFNWGNDNWEGDNKYELLLEGAKFADKNGFCAVWTPERHFHAFGGLYPNPSVTGAAIAAVTKNLAVRAGSIVAPLHHPIRIAEEWAVIDNMTNGRVGLAIASGWHPNDFVLRPENTPPNNKPAMFEAIKTIRKLWAGEAVDFPAADGRMVPVVTHPRPLSKDMPMWVTTAGNPETWRDAGTAGANVLTHLLGQSIAEVAEKTVIYHDALRAAGYDPKDFTVTLMLHTYVGATRELAREKAREPMKSYLRSAAGLIKQFAWAFPAFKRPEGVNNPFELDLDVLSKDELEAILDFAFERYFEDSGLFGTVEDCLARVEQLKRIGVGEVACLVDYGLPVAEVMEGLKPLAEVLRRANTATVPAAGDYSIAAQISRHNVTHLQCTPSMGRMLLADDASHLALRGIQQLLIGGEPLPGTMVDDFAKITDAPITNMYGPTETTIWSSSEAARATDGLVNIGNPIANTQMYVLDNTQQPQPIGVPGELYIGGAGVTRGYWQRPELTAERYLDNPFTDGGRMYRTGDLVSWRGDGKIEFFGRVDNQVKLRGHRIELGEIEAYLEAHKSIRQAVTIAREIADGDTRLVAYLVCDNAVPDAELRDLLAVSLPDYMVPSFFVTLDKIPLTPNKKVDRKALPEPQLAKVKQSNVVKAAPSNSTEQKIATIWTRILGVAKIGSADNFFDLGGHSLLAVQAHREIKADLDAPRLSITDIFRFPVLSALAKRLDGDSPTTAEKPVAEVARQAQQRSDAMSKRRAMRARRGGV